MHRAARLGQSTCPDPGSISGTARRRSVGLVAQSSSVIGRLPPATRLPDRSRPLLSAPAALRGNPPGRLSAARARCCSVDGSRTSNAFGSQSTTRRVAVMRAAAAAAANNRLCIYSLSTSWLAQKRLSFKRHAQRLVQRPLRATTRCLATD